MFASEPSSIALVVERSNTGVWWDEMENLLIIIGSGIYKLCKKKGMCICLLLSEKGLQYNW